MVSENISRGIADFNAGRYFEAHEFWEQIWKHARSDDRAEWKALIQVCGVGVHLMHARPDPAQRLARRARQHFAEARQRETVAVGVRIRGVDEFLERLALRENWTDAAIAEELRALKNLEAAWLF